LGSEAGNSIASILAGDANPSGKLPFTFPVKLEDNSAHQLGEYPGKKMNWLPEKEKIRKTRSILLQRRNFCRLQMA
jgi:beta-glucosidase